MNILAQLQAFPQNAPSGRVQLYQGTQFSRLIEAMADGKEWNTHRAADEMGWDRNYASAVLCALHKREKIECVRLIKRVGRAMKVYRRKDV